MNDIPPSAAKSPFSIFAATEGVASSVGLAASADVSKYLRWMEGFELSEGEKEAYLREILRVAEAFTNWHFRRDPTHQITDVAIGLATDSVDMLASEQLLKHQDDFASCSLLTDEPAGGGIHGIGKD
jgi:hypothetical protein